ncbi:MAG: DNA phosphorothioation-associated putative methyltransferase [Synechococcaceae cyanobacterium SM2_3_1]|nr:DNA phosphorothioation-associated putative methyltransferase [Synechococcaceae cyanobacterium SM2_3_1]
MVSNNAFCFATNLPLMVSDVALKTIVDRCQCSPIGKLLPDSLYVHLSALSVMDPVLQAIEQQARQRVKNLESVTLVKFHFEQPKVSYLAYPDFDTDPHPALHTSIQVDLTTGQVNQRDYTQTANPPILHRKETFVASDYPLYQDFAELTRQEEKLGLLAQSRSIGTHQNWQQRLQEFGITIQGHQVSTKGHHAKLLTPQIQRHRAAIVRTDLSKPVRSAVEAGLFTEGSTFFDYGCGHGNDLKLIRHQGFTSEGWDPHYRPNAPRIPADIVNLGYIINVIEDPVERRQALLNAWELTQQVMIVAAQVLVEDATRGQIAYGDGIITCRNTFQKYYDQEELKAYIDQVLSVDAIPVALGIYFVFRDEAQAQTFRTCRFRSRATTPRIQKQVKRFDDYRELLTPLMEFVTERGRLPIKGELLSESEIMGEFGSLHRAFQVILQVTDQQEWHQIAEQRKQDLMLYLALTNFGHRPKLNQLTSEVQKDLKALFGTYRQACSQADDMLKSLGNLSLVAEKCRSSSIGKRGSKSLTVHITALEKLDPLLRLYESCASRTIGRPEEATLVKFHSRQPKIAYLFYPTFDTDSHPPLHTYMEIDLRDLHVKYQDFDADDNAPILHRKETLVTPDYPLYERFAKLTKQEEGWGLLDDEQGIRKKRGWLKCLDDHCATLQGHRVIWRKDADPYKIKLLRSRIRSRQKQRPD